MSNMMSLLFSVFICGAFLSGLFQRPSPFIDREVAGKQVLRSEWTEIKLDQPLKPVGDRQEIGLYLAEPFKMDLLDSLGVRVADGTLIVPEVELVTSEGRTVKMKCSGSRGEETLTYRLQDESVKQDYVRIRIRADREIPLEAIYWTGIVIKNMP